MNITVKKINFLVTIYSGLYTKLSSSKKISLQEKFEEAKQKLIEIYKIYPDVNPNRNDAIKLELNTSLEHILRSI
jgi:hypothetical protein